MSISSPLLIANVAFSSKSPHVPQIGSNFTPILSARYSFTFSITAVSSVTLLPCKYHFKVTTSSPESALPPASVPPQPANMLTTIAKTSASDTSFLFIVKPSILFFYLCQQHPHMLINTFCISLLRNQRLIRLRCNVGRTDMHRQSEELPLLPVPFANSVSVSGQLP